MDPPPHRGDPAEHLHARGHRDDHGGGHEVGAQVHRHADGVHVVGPHDEADEADGHHGVGHGQVTEHRLARERRDDVADDAEARQDQDVHFRVPEEPEQVLVHDRVAAAGGVEEVRVEVSVREQHRDRAGQDRQRQKQQEHGHQHRPDEQRHPVQGHSRRAHVEDGGDEVDGAQDRGGAGQVDRQDGQVHGGASVARGRQRRIEGPAAAEAEAGTAVHEHRDAQQDPGRHQQPERDIVHPREGHVRRADHQRHEPVAEAADHRRHDHEEDHDQGVGGDHHVVAVLAGLDQAELRQQAAVAEHLDARLGQFPADQAGERPAHQARHDGEQQVQGADVLVVGGIHPAAPAVRVVVCVVVPVGVVMVENCAHRVYLKLLNYLPRWARTSAGWTTWPVLLDQWFLV